MTLMREVFPCVAQINGTEQYAIGALRIQDKDTLTAIFLQTADNAANLGTSLAGDYYTRTGGASIEYRIPAEAQPLPIIRPLDITEQESFYQAFRRASEPR